MLVYVDVMQMQTTIWVTQLKTKNKERYGVKMNPLSNLMKLKDFAKEMKVSESTVRTWKIRGNIPAECFFTLGGTVFIKVDKFAELSA